MFTLLVLVCIGTAFANLTISEYLVENPMCKIPNIPFFHLEAQLFYEKLNYDPCRTKKLLSYITKSPNKSSATLHIREDLLPLYGDNGPISCCFSDITVNTNETFTLRELHQPNYRLSNCRSFVSKSSFTHDMIMVKCADRNGEIIYRNTHATFLINNASVESEKQRLNVLLIVADSLSRLNFKRTMPETNSFLLQNNFIEMKGYNKVGSRTLPNFLAMLTGLSQREAVRNGCTSSKILNKCSFIWSSFAKFGYKTAFLEDLVRLTTFQYYFLPHGNAVDPLVNYYLNPYLVSSAAELQTDYGEYCIGNEPSAERVLNLAGDFAQTFRDHFGVFWMNTFSHEGLNDPTRMDHKLKKFFSKLNLSKSVVVFVSDHGFQGMEEIAGGGFPGSWFEERLPIGMISVPEDFRRQNPELYENLVGNSDQLTSPFDLYMTLQHILSLSEPTFRMKRIVACRGCRSLFKRLPRERSCKDAGIPEKFCTCNGNFTPNFT